MNTIITAEAIASRVEHLVQARELLAHVPDAETGTPLLVRKEKDRVVLHALTGPTLVGREVAQGLRFNDPAMSGRHFELVPDAAGCLARDLGSANGLWINGKRCQSRRLLHGDILRAGGHEFVFHDGTVPARMEEWE